MTTVMQPAACATCEGTGVIGDVTEGTMSYCPTCRCFCGEPAYGGICNLHFDEQEERWSRR